MVPMTMTIPKYLSRSCAVVASFFASSLSLANHHGEVRVFLEKNGLVSIEAEHYDRQELTHIRKWRKTTIEKAPKVKPDADPSHADTASGSAYLEILPDSRQTHDDLLENGISFSNEPGKLGILYYKVRFENAGRYYVWVRAHSTGPEDNGIHVGLNRDWPDSGQRMQWCKGKQSWYWNSAQRTAEVHCGVPGLIYLDVEEAGDHVIKFSMREDGFEFDKFILTTDAEFERPADAGPAESPRS